ncbi:PQ-loop-domain-containing protein [Ascobolus immersus RN42]|uniref:PQ-loop-domain-containing protein n=1 Tax=Ascobolus immersus RN42 TaxID=1160509 RepID=A0A3N4HTI0_ASCIM|nr:PQ-loop-domain-containing protein [Ascobolus immersus RN42]
MDGIATLPPREALSGISSSISLVSWVIVLVPQLLENYKNGNADGLSLGFLFAWLAGDIANLAGALWGGLLPSVIAIGIYFCIADFLLITQSLYYRYVTHSVVIEPETSPSEPLLHSSQPARRHSNGLGRRISSASRRSSMSARRVSVSHQEDTLSKMLFQETSAVEAAAKNALALIGICVVGTVGWYVAWQAGAWRPEAPPGEGPENPDSPLGAQILGYISALLYLSARIPQIIQNHKNKSTEGLSLLFFMISMLGNISYSGGIIFHSTDRKYILELAPWILGSLGTVAEDLYIFGQFQQYKRKKAHRRFHSIPA